MAFVFGLFVGPAIGLGIVMLWLRRTVTGVQVLAVLALVAVFLLFVPVLSLDLKLGLIAGVMVGALLAATPSRVDSAPEA